MIARLPDGQGFAKWLLDAEGERCKAKQVVQNMQKVSKASLIKKRRADYELLKADKNYFDVQFNNENGGVKATHKLHNLSKQAAKYEKKASDILFKTGNKIILEDETTGNDKKVDGSFNDLPADINSILGTGKNTVVRALLHSKRKNAKAAILYFPDKSNYSTARFKTAVKRFNGQTDYRFKKIVVIVEKEILKG